MQLSDQQKAAVETESPMALVAAGAGSGKTRVFTERIKHLIWNRGVSPHDLFVTTFTRKAAEEIRTRLEMTRATLPFSGTIHSIALNFIRQYAHRLDIDLDRFSILTQKEFDMLVKDAADAVGVCRRRRWTIPKKDVDAIFHDRFNNGATVLPEDPKLNRACEVVGTATFNYVREQAFPYGDILIMFRKLIPMIQDNLYFKHILVDEVQDMNPLQWEIILTLADISKADLFLVGDMDQSIYEWRGASPKKMKSVSETDKCDVFRLETNYRSSACIVDGASRLIAHNNNRVPIEAKTANDSPGIVTVFKYLSKPDLAELMMTARGLDRNEDSGPAMVLARTHRILDRLAEEFDARAVHYQRLGRAWSLAESDLFIRFTALVRCLINPFDNRSFSIMMPLLEPAHTSFAKLYAKSLENDRSVFREFVASMDFECGNFALKELLIGWPFMDGKHILSWALPPMVDAAFPFPEHDDVKQLIYKIIDRVMALNQTIKVSTLSDYLDYVAGLSEAAPPPEVHGDCVEPDFVLSTIHAAKGLEADTVYVLRCNEGDLPMAKAAHNEAEMEAERRLAYVAFTRARKNLVLCVNSNFDASRFIKEFMEVEQW